MFDVDDAIWVPYESDFSAEIARRCDGVIAGNRFLAEHYERLGAKVWLVPTSVDADVWRPVNKVSGQWTIGWTGSSANLRFLYAIEQPLTEFLATHPDSRLLIVCNRRPSFERLQADRWDFAFWSMENEVRHVQRMDVGLMPLADSELARGKCGFKMLSYMAVGLPVIVSSVGVNQEILARGELGLSANFNDEWYQALERLYDNRELSARMGAAGRRVAEEHYSVKANVVKLASIFREVAES